MPISVVIISKDEPTLDETLSAVSAAADRLQEPSEIVVVDASDHRLDFIRDAHPEVRWIEFAPPAGVRTSIPHQRNLGVRQSDGDIVAFTDSGCVPQADWLVELTAPIRSARESVTVGRTVSRDPTTVYVSTQSIASGYVEECPTINLAFSRQAFDLVGGFDEQFAYGSDVDFSWRLRDAGFRLRTVPEAVVSVEWGSTRRQIKRAWSYGRARARLYRKHRERRRTAWRRDPVPLAYAGFILGLPLTVIMPLYPLLLLIPIVKNRSSEHLALTLVDHLVYAVGFMTELAQFATVAAPHTSAARRSDVES